MLRFPGRRGQTVRNWQPFHEIQPLKTEELEVPSRSRDGAKDADSFTKYGNNNAVPFGATSVSRGKVGIIDEFDNKHQVDIDM